MYRATSEDTQIATEEAILPTDDPARSGDRPASAPAIAEDEGCPIVVGLCHYSFFTREAGFVAVRCRVPLSLFAYICDSMQWLDIAEKNFANFHLTFLMRMSRFLGFYPNLDDYVDGCVFDLRAATFSLLIPTHRDFLQPDDARRIHTLMRMDFPTMHLYRLNRTDRNRIVDVLLRYYSLHIPQFPELKSLSVLQELWAE